MGYTEVLILEDKVIINLKKGGVSTFTWEEFDELEVAFDVVRRLSGAIRDRKMLITIKDQKD